MFGCEIKLENVLVKPYSSTNVSRATDLVETSLEQECFVGVGKLFSFSFSVATSSCTFLSINPQLVREHFPKVVFIYFTHLAFPESCSGHDKSLQKLPSNTLS